MLTFQFSFGNGDRALPTITDEYIMSEEMARQRAIQEICEAFKIVISKELQTTVTPDLDLGQTRHISIPHLAMYGNHRVVAITTTLSLEGSYDDVTVEAYKDMDLPR